MIATCSPVVSILEEKAFDGKNILENRRRYDGLYSEIGVIYGRIKEADANHPHRTR